MFYENIHLCPHNIERMVIPHYLFIDSIVLCQCAFACVRHCSIHSSIHSIPSHHHHHHQFIQTYNLIILHYLAGYRVPCYILFYIFFVLFYFIILNYCKTTK